MPKTVSFFYEKFEFSNLFSAEGPSRPCDDNISRRRQSDASPASSALAFSSSNAPPLQLAEQNEYEVDEVRNSLSEMKMTGNAGANNSRG